MGISRNYGPSAGTLGGVMSNTGQKEEEEKRFQQYLAMLAQIRSQNMNDGLSRDQLALDRERFDMAKSQQDIDEELARERLAMDKKRQEFDTRQFNTINYVPRAQTPIGGNFRFDRGRGVNGVG